MILKIALKTINMMKSNYNLTTYLDFPTTFMRCSKMSSFDLSNVSIKIWSPVSINKIDGY